MSDFRRWLLDTNCLQDPESYYENDPYTKRIVINHCRTGCPVTMVCLVTSLLEEKALANGIRGGVIGYHRKNLYIHLERGSRMEIANVTRDDQRIDGHHEPMDKPA